MNYFLCLIMIVCTTTCTHSIDTQRYYQARDTFAKSVNAFNNKNYDTALLGFNSVINITQKYSDDPVFKMFLIKSLLNKGILLSFKKNAHESATAYKQALDVEPFNTDIMMTLASAYAMLGFSAQDASYFDRAGKLFETVLSFEPTHQKAQLGLAHVSRYVGNATRAMHLYQTVLDNDPTNVLALFRLAEEYLALGDWDNGIPAYEKRLRWTGIGETYTKKDGVVTFLYEWDGTCDVTNKTVLIESESGIGDTFQFIRYAKLLKEQGAHTILVTRPCLVPILSCCPYLDQVISFDTAMPHFDLHVQTMSFPHKFNTRIKTIPELTPYLHADKQLTKEWGKRIAHDTNFKIGICWCGEVNEPVSKFMPLTYFAELGRIPGVSMYSIQKQSGFDQMTQWPADIKLHRFANFDEEHGAFMDTAALITHMDCIVSVDTSVAHLSAGLGAHTCIILSAIPEWRWQCNNTTSPWYNTARLFRQKTLGQWDTVCNELITYITQLIQE